MGRPRNIGRKWYHPKKPLIDLPTITTPFATGIIDPPWQYDAKPSGVLRKRQSALRREDNTCAVPPYQTLTFEEIKNLPIGDVIGGYLFLWTTYGYRDRAMDCLEGWGFEYKSELVWGKINSQNLPAHGCGFWMRGAHEICLIGKKPGMPCIRTSQRSLLLVPKRRHSEKPPHIHRLIERHYPEPYVELFARKHVHGWTCHGNEVDGGRDIRDVLEQYLPTAPAAPKNDDDNVVRMDRKEFAKLLKEAGNNTKKIRLAVCHR